MEKDICYGQNVSVKLLCVCVCLLSGDLLIFLVEVPSFFFYFFVIRTLVLSSLHGLFPCSIFSKVQNIFCFNYFNRKLIITRLGAAFSDFAFSHDALSLQNPCHTAKMSASNRKIHFIMLK